MSDKEHEYEDFISTVSHELRTPLTSIRGFSQTMLASWDKIDDDSKKKFLKIIEEQSERLIHLVESMLAVTKIQSSKDLLVYNQVDVKSVIEQTVSMIKNQYNSQKFEFKFVENIPEIFADKDKFQQIITNLIENSAKYSQDDKKTLINVFQSDNNVVIEISNTGIHIEESDYNKIFTKFSRIDNPLTRKVQGSGLGLYITKSLTEKMGGKFSVKSIPIENKSGLSKIIFTLEMPIKNIEEQARIKCSL